MTYFTNTSNKDITYKGMTVRPMESILLDENGFPTKGEASYIEDKLVALDKRVDEVSNVSKKDVQGVEAETKAELDKIASALQDLDKKTDTNIQDLDKKVDTNIASINKSISTVDKKVDTACTNLTKSVNTTCTDLSSNIKTTCTSLVTCINNSISTVNTNLGKKADSTTVTKTTNALKTIKIPEIKYATFTSNEVDVSTSAPLTNSNAASKCFTYAIKTSAINNFSAAKEYFVTLNGCACVCVCNITCKGIQILGFDTTFDMKKAQTISVNAGRAGACDLNLWAKVEPTSTGAKLTFMHKNGCAFCATYLRGPTLSPEYYTLSV